MVGTSGSCTERFALVTPIGLNLPERTCGIDAVRLGIAK